MPLRFRVGPEMRKGGRSVTKKMFWNSKYIVVLIQNICIAAAHSERTVETIYRPLDRLHFVRHFIYIVVWDIHTPVKKKLVTLLTYRYIVSVDIYKVFIIRQSLCKRCGIAA